MFGNWFPKSSFKFTEKCQVTHPWTNYANLWFILLHVTKDFRFQKLFVSFLATFHPKDFCEKWKQFTMWSTYFNQQTLIVSLFRIYHIVMHMTNIFWNNKFLTGVQDQNFLFTFLTKDYEAKFRQIAFSELVRISYKQHLPPKFFQYLLT